MKFQFEYLQPKVEAIQIIECYETLGYTPYFDSESSPEEQQIFDDSDYVTLFLKKDCCDTLPLYLPKDAFGKKIKYYDWMLREEFEKLCEQNEDYKYIDLVLLKSKDEFHRRDSMQQFKVIGNVKNFAIGYYDGTSWCNSDEFDAEPCKYVKLIKCEEQ